MGLADAMVWKATASALPLARNENGAGYSQGFWASASLVLSSSTVTGVAISLWIKNGRFCTIQADTQ
jgi:hypothetical protein